MTLGRLGREASRALLAERAPGLPPALADRVLAEADGNPLALLELPAALSGSSKVPVALAASLELPAPLPLPMPVPFPWPRDSLTPLASGSPKVGALIFETFKSGGPNKDGSIGSLGLGF